MSKRTYILLLAVLVIAGCGQKKAERFTALPFPDITLPSMIQSQQDVTEYYAEHYWDNLTSADRDYPSDSLIVSGVRIEDVLIYKPDGSENITHSPKNLIII